MEKYYCYQRRKTIGTWTGKNGNVKVAAIEVNEYLTAISEEEAGTYPVADEDGLNKLCDWITTLEDVEAIAAGYEEALVVLQDGTVLNITSYDVYDQQEWKGIRQSKK